MSSISGTSYYTSGSSTSGLGTTSPAGTIQADSPFNVTAVIQSLTSSYTAQITNLEDQETTLQGQETEYSTIQGQATAVSNALTALIPDAALGASSNPFLAMTASSTDSSALNATVVNGAPPGTYSINVLSLATATTASSLNSIGLPTNGSDGVAGVQQGAITAGNFTIYVNNQAESISVTPGSDTVQDVLNRIAAAVTSVTGQSATASIGNNDAVQLTYAPGTTINFGSSGDTSNFAQIMQLTTGSADSGEDTFTASGGTSTLNTAGTLIGNGASLADGNITAGTVTIGGAQFTINNTTTLSGLISQINSNSSSGVYASYNTTTGKLNLISTTTGNQAIYLNDGGTGVLSALGLANGNDTLSSQTLGQNAQIQVDNGSVIQSTSNTITPATSGLTGVTLNLTSTTPTNSPAILTVSQNTSQIVSSLNTFISAFNTLTSTIQVNTAANGTLQGDTALEALRETLMGDISANTGASPYNSLDAIGISTGAVDPSATTSDPANDYSLDSSQLLAALASNPTQVQQLLVGNGTTTGILTTLQNDIQSATDSVNGIFAAENESVSTDITNINNTITQQQALLASQTSQLQSEFTQMQENLSTYQSQSSALASLEKESDVSSSSSSSSSS